ncbi:hypothetical protein SOVF_087600 [Spinacia oleracea]|uniref:Pentatricopeptide repeat-containing protein At1g69290 n=1 Tax=Spinacia oleracea TaxID=3562 RepID=A0A9R0ID78_SPIOL|nr:pentatricopeptide repeat-containing protein At1g69290 [Spinacia oleracea]KNA16569.1 hypothetical protein SOVF_087600 [Spinacia oleracea]
MWRRRAFSLLRPPQTRPFSTTTTTTATGETPSLYSFLQPSLFSLKPQQTASPPSPPPTSSKIITPEHKTTLEITLQQSLSTADTDEAWKSFKSLTNTSSYPSKSLTNSLITHLSSLSDVHNLKRAFTAVVFLVEKNPNLLDFDSVSRVLSSMAAANYAAPAFSLVKCMFKNRFFVPFDMCGPVLVEISKKNGSFVGYLGVFHENCRVAIDEKLDFMKPNLDACNAALEGCCSDLESVEEAERVIELMSVLGVRPNELSFGLLGYLYALKGLEGKIVELGSLMGGFGFTDKMVFLSYLIRGYVKAGSMESVSKTVLCSLKAGEGDGSKFSEETYCEIVKGFLKHGSIKDLAALVAEAQMSEPENVVGEQSTGFGIVNACTVLGMLDKAHSILDEMKAKGAVVGLGVYLSILKAYCKEYRTAEAAQMVAEINCSGLHLDVSCYDSLIEASMSSQDFQSAFSLFRDMRDARISELKGSYLTIMTGLTENNRPELMAAFLDEVVEDPRIEVGTHDWNSIIHAFCKAGRLEDASRTFRRMAFLHFGPNEQTYLSLINGYVVAGKYFNVLMLWNEVKRRVSTDDYGGFKLNHKLIDAFLYALVKGGFFDAVMQVVDKSREWKIFIDKWRYKQAFMETHKKLKVSKLRRKNFKKMEALIAFKNWAGLSV